MGSSPLHAPRWRQVGFIGQDNCATQTLRKSSPFATRGGRRPPRIPRMTSPPDVQHARTGRHRVSVGLAVALTFPGIILRLGIFHTPHAVEAVLFGLAIVGAAFLLSWAAEVA